MKKYICPNCKADLKEVGIRNAQEGICWYDCDIINDKGELGNWEEDEFEARDWGEFYCGDCNQEINMKKLGLIL